jgi:haloalkane dehalogenase
MEVLRTPDERFQGLAEYDFAPTYVEIADGDGTALRIHAVDEGPASASPVLLMHGEPSWSYLYRRMIRGLAARGHRVVAPDLVGFGRSDKPSEQADYTYERHVAWMSAWLAALQLTDVTLFGQDWGGLIGLRLVAAFPERFARVVVANTGLPIGAGMTDGFKRWLEYSQSVPELPVGAIVARSTARGLSAAEIAAYDAPFPEERFKAGARRFPALVPVTPDHASVAENKAAWARLEAFAKPFLTSFSDGDPITRGGERAFQKRVPGARGQPHRTVAGAGHFLQEDRPEELVALIDEFIDRAR